MKVAIFVIMFLIVAGAIGKYTFMTFVYDRGETTPAAGESMVVEPLPSGSQLPPDVLAAINEKSDLILVRTPVPLSVVGSPLTVSGLARGTWYFEGSFPVVVTDWDGLIIGEGFVTAQTDWMTEEYVPFTGTITFKFPPETPYNRGTLILQKANASGLPERDDALEIPIVFTEE